MKVTAVVPSYEPDEKLIQVVDGLLAGMDGERITLACTQAAALYETANKARNLKAEYDLSKNKNVSFVLKTANGVPQDILSRLSILANAKSVTRDASYAAPKGTPAALTPLGELFLPLEGLYAEVMRNAEVVETLQREQRILVAGPSTLLALLNSLQMGFRTLAIEQRSAEVWKLLHYPEAAGGGQDRLRQLCQGAGAHAGKASSGQRQHRQCLCAHPQHRKAPPQCGSAGRKRSRKISAAGYAGMNGSFHAANALQSLFF